MTVIRLAGRRAHPILDLHRRMLDTKALSQATQHHCQHLLSIRAFKELGVQGDDWNFSGERPRMYMVDARYSGNPVQLRFDLPDIAACRRSFEEHVRGIASELPARTQDQGRYQDG